MDGENKFDSYYEEKVENDALSKEKTDSLEY